ncbi:RNA polymerase sigma factor [Acidicapsa ligni]|uniref:RNA polymerase sigma factor n=1 Tax=Acidicapsa ligni TaxID=542300 RepID=UPI0021E0703C|nr:sigma-70 family RNA polymerase sigma factor [Acidicapsa ligni]
MRWPFQITSTLSIQILLAGGDLEGEARHALPVTPPETAGQAAFMDNEDFACFYARSARPLWAYIARVSGDRALADDLMQESFVRFLCALNRPRQQDGEVASRRYLFRIATNLLRDHWKSPRNLSIEDVPEEFFSATCNAGHNESQAILDPAMAQMRPRERQILWLAHAEGYSHKEIAEVTGLASASVRLLLFRARRKIAALLRTPHRPTMQDRKLP